MSTDREQTDRQGETNLPLQTSFSGVIVTNKEQIHVSYINITNDMYPALQNTQIFLLQNFPMEIFVEFPITPKMDHNKKYQCWVYQSLLLSY